MKLKIQLYFLCFSIVGIIYATPQSPDELLYNGEKYHLLQSPLEGYFFENPHKRPEAVSTGEWKGYHAVFEINQNKLYVITINENDDRSINVITNYFNELNKIFLNQWSGMLIIPDGKYLTLPNGKSLELLDKEILEYYGREIIYERLKFYEYYKFIEIKNGNVINEYRMSNEQYRKYESIIDNLFTKTKEFKEIFGEWAEVNKEYDEIYSELNDGVLPIEIVKYIKKNYKVTTSFKYYLPVIYYNNFMSTPLIQEYAENNLGNNKANSIYRIIIIVGIICIILILIFIFNKKIKLMSNRNVA